MADDDLSAQEALIWRARAPYTAEQAAALLHDKNPELVILPPRTRFLADDIRRHFDHPEPLAGSGQPYRAYDLEDGQGPYWVTFERLEECARAYGYSSALVLDE